jgi:hypothetical protein
VGPRCYNTRMAEKPARKSHRLLRAYETPHCPGCAFELKGLPPQGTCPECGCGYDAASCAALRRGPEVLPAIAHVFGPAFLGGLIAAATVATSMTSSMAYANERTVLLLGWTAFIGLCAGVTLTCWRGIVLLQAILEAQPASIEESPRARILGCAGTGLLGIVGVVSFACTVLGTVVATACLVNI